MRKKPRPTPPPRRAEPRPATTRTRPAAPARPKITREDAAAERAIARAVAVDIIREAEETDQPADRVLRERMRSARPSSGAAAAIAHTVFTWYRWRGFLHGDEPDLESIEHAYELAGRFTREARAFPDTALLDGAVPGWITDHMEVEPAFLRALQTEPTLWLRARSGQAAALARELPGARAGLHPGLPEAVHFTGAGDLFKTAPFLAGRFEIQDIASQAVGAVCAPGPGETWWDACAGEGGKMLHLSDLMQNRGLIWASDRSAARLDTLKRRASRAGVFNYRAAAWDGDERLPTRGKFDGVLLDAPCSGVGTWQRNPHARWTTGPADVRDLARIQAALLHYASAAVKEGGKLIYSVCTLTRDETDEVAAGFQREHPQFEPTSVADPFAPDAPPRPTHLWGPHETAGNGMYVAAWRRISR